MRTEVLNIDVRTYFCRKCVCAFNFRAEVQKLKVVSIFVVRFLTYRHITGGSVRVLLPYVLLSDQDF